MNYASWLRSAIIAGLGLAIIVPFIVMKGTWFPDAMFFPFITGKNFAFRIITEIIFGLYVILAIKDPQYRPRFSWILGAALLLTLWAGVATIFSVDPVKSFWSNFERMEGFVGLLHLFLYFVVASAILNTERLWTWFLRGNVIAGTAMALYGIGQYLGIFAISTQSGPRLDGTLGNATYMAVYMLFTIFFSALLLKREWSNTILRWTYIVAIILQTFVLFYTQTRGTVLGLIAGLLVACAYLIFATRRSMEYSRLRKVSIGSLVGIVVLVGVFILVRDNEYVKHIPAFERLASISLHDRTTESRFIIWNMAWKGFLERPVTGWGQENFNFVFNKYYDPVMYNQEQWFDRAHDAYLDWLVTTGAPGFILFIALFLLSAWAVFRSGNLSVPEKAALIGLIAAFGVHEIFVFDNIVSSIDFFIILALAHHLSRRQLPGNLTLAKPASDHAVAIAAPVVAILSIAGLWFFNGNGIANAEEMIQALQVSSANDLPTSLNHFKTVLNRGELGKQEAAEQIVQMAANAASVQGISPQIVQDFYNGAHDAMTTIITQRPNDARLELFFGSFLDQFGQYAEAKTHLDKALALSPAKQTTLFEIGINNRQKVGDNAGMLDALKKAYDLEPSYDRAAIYYASALFNTGEKTQSDAIIQKTFGSLTPDNELVFEAYAQMGQYDRAKTIVENRIAKNPNDAQSLVQLAQVLYTQGDKKGAVEALQEASKVVTDPNLASQIQQMIQEAQQ